jgi:hypothetical protein
LKFQTPKILRKFFQPKKEGKKGRANKRKVKKVKKVYTFSSSISATSRQRLQQLCRTATSEMPAQFRPPVTSTTSAQCDSSSSCNHFGANRSASDATQLRSFYNSIQRQCLSPPTVDVRTRSRNRQSALYGGDAAPAAATSVITAQLHCRYCVFSDGEEDAA